MEHTQDFPHVTYKPQTTYRIQPKVTSEQAESLIVQ